MKTINTQEAYSLIKKGWILKTHKDPLYHHQIWLKDPTHDRPGCARYLTHGIYRNLLKIGVDVVEVKSEICKIKNKEKPDENMSKV